MNAHPAQSLRSRVFPLPNLILNPFTYGYQTRDVPRAVARMVRFRLVRLGNFGCRCDREGGSLLRFSPEAGDQVPGGGPHRHPSGKLGSLQSTDNKSVRLGESPICRSRQSARRHGVTVLYRVRAATLWRLRSLIGLHRMMRVPAGPAERAIRLVPESSRKEVPSTHTCRANCEVPKGRLLVCLYLFRARLPLALQPPAAP